MCRLRNIALESVTDRQTDRQTDGRTTDKVIPMCRYASQATQKNGCVCETHAPVCNKVQNGLFLVQRSQSRSQGH